MDTLHNHLEMIDLNPLVEERHPIKPPPDATPEEFHCLWYSLTDRVSYMPGGLITGKVSFNVCFHDLDRGLQTHCYAPMGLNIKGKWTLGGSLPGEPVAPVELGIGAPLSGLYLREDVDIKCNIMMTTFVKKTLKAAHARLVDRLVVKAQFEDATLRHERLSQSSRIQTHSRFPGSQTTTEYSPSDYGDPSAGLEDGSMHRSSSRFSDRSGAPSNLDFHHSPPSSSQDTRGRNPEPATQTQSQSPHPPSLTIQGAHHHSRSFSEQRQQRQVPDFDAPLPQAPYPVSAAGTPPDEGAPSWQVPPPAPAPANRNHVMEELHMALEEAKPGYRAYVKGPSPLQLNPVEPGQNGGQSRERTYSDIPRVYGAAELA